MSGATSPAMAAHEYRQYLRTLTANRSDSVLGAFRYFLVLMLYGQVPGNIIKQKVWSQPSSRNEIFSLNYLCTNQTSVAAHVFWKSWQFRSQNNYRPLHQTLRNGNVSFQTTYLSRCFLLLTPFPTPWVPQAFIVPRVTALFGGGSCLYWMYIISHK